MLQRYVTATNYHYTLENYGGEPVQGDDNLALSVCTDGGKKLRVRRIDTCASMGAHRSCPSQQLIAWGLHR